MHKEWADKWVAALRSGKYKQGKHVLRNMNDEYCCLGVLCEIAETPKEKTMFDHMETEVYVYGEEVDRNSSLLPESVCTKVGMKSNNGQMTENVDELAEWEGPIYLTSANDTYDWDFNKIADFIEKNYEKL